MSAQVVELARVTTLVLLDEGKYKELIDFLLIMKEQTPDELFLLKIWHKGMAGLIDICITSRTPKEARTRIRQRLEKSPLLQKLGSSSESTQQIRSHQKYNRPNNDSR